MGVCGGCECGMQKSQSRGLGEKASGEVVQENKRAQEHPKAIGAIARHSAAELA